MNQLHINWRFTSTIEDRRGNIECIGQVIGILMGKGAAREQGLDIVNGKAGIVAKAFRTEQATLNTNVGGVASFARVDDLNRVCGNANARHSSRARSLAYLNIILAALLPTPTSGPAGRGRFLFHLVRRRPEPRKVLRQVVGELLVIV